MSNIQSNQFAKTVTAIIKKFNTKGKGMEFNISYYNGFGYDNVNTFENSIKAAYLYADSIKLYDNLFIISPFLDILNKSSWQKNPYWLYLSKLDNDDFKKFLQSKEKINKLSIDEIDMTIERIDRELLQIHEYELKESYQKSLEEIMHSGIYQLVDIQQVNMEKADYINDIIQSCINEFVSSNDFHMINKNNSELFSANRHSNANNLNTVKLTNYIFTQLPAFDVATVDEIIDIKKELSKYIISFRKAMLGFSDKLSDIPEQDFEFACQKLYHMEIAPKVNDIEQAIRDNQILKNIVANIFTNPEYWAGVGSLAVAYTSGNSILSSISYAGTIGFWGTTLSKTIQEHRKNTQIIRSNELYFYYEVKQKINKYKE